MISIVENEVICEIFLQIRLAAPGMPREHYKRKYGFHRTRLQSENHTVQLLINFQKSITKYTYKTAPRSAILNGRHPPIFYISTSSMSLMLNLKLTRYLQNFSSSNVQGQRNIAILFAASMILSLALAILWDYTNRSWADSSPPSINYHTFNQYEAELICEDKMQDQLGDSLVRSYVDEHSTRFDELAGIFRIYLVADIGSHTDFKEVMIYCQVSDYDHELAYYKLIDPSLKPFTYADIKFFGK